MGPDDFPRYRQSQTGARTSSGLRLPESIEEVIQIVRGDAIARIRDRDLQSVLRRTRRYHHGTCRRVSHGVVEQVVEHLDKPVVVGFNRRRVICDLNPEFDALVCSA